MTNSHDTSLRVSDIPSNPNNFGLSTTASLSVTTIVTSQYTVVEAFGYKTAGRLGGALTTAAIGVVDVVDAIKDGNSKDVAVQVAGVGGGIGGGLLGGMAAGAAVGAVSGNPGVVVAFSIVGGVAGAYFGEVAVQNFISDQLTPTPNVDRLRYQTQFRSSDSRDSAAREALESGASAGESSDPSTKYIAHQDRESGAQVVTTVISDPVTHQQRAVYSTVTAGNEVHPELNGYTYPPGHVQAGYELNALDRISEVGNLWSNTNSPRATGAQGNGILPSYTNDPRGPWQMAEPSVQSQGDTTNRDRQGADGRGPFGVTQDSHGDHQATASVQTGQTRTTTTAHTRSSTSNSHATSVGDYNRNYDRDRQSGTGYDHTAYEDRRPILLDLDGNGVSVAELGRSTVFLDSDGDGLANRTAWAGVGDGVLFYDAGGDGKITQDREFVFTEWDPTAKDDRTALRSRGKEEECRHPRFGQVSKARSRMSCAETGRARAGEVPVIVVGFAHPTRYHLRTGCVRRLAIVKEH